MLLFTIKRFILNIFPVSYQKIIKKKYRSLIKLIHGNFSKDEFKQFLVEKMNIKNGSVVFVHSSVDKLNINFSFFDIIPILRDITGNDGTLLFPCWQYSGRAKDYLKNSSVVFDVRKTPTAQGILPEIARYEPDMFRSLHPTNSVVALGKHAQKLTEHHHETIYPCGEKSPFYEIVKYNGLIIGLGVSTENLSFVHTIEDALKLEFPVELINKKELYKCNVIDNSGSKIEISTMVATGEAPARNVPHFVKRYIDPSICQDFKYRGMNFFVADSFKLHEIMLKLAKENITIYSS